MAVRKSTTDNSSELRRCATSCPLASVRAETDGRPTAILSPRYWFRAAGLLALLVISLGGATSASAASCGAEGGIFMHPPSVPQTHGVQALVYEPDRSSTCAGGIIAGATSIEGIGGSSSSPFEWAEIGWRLKAASLGSHDWVLFVEHGQNGVADYVQEFYSACAAPSQHAYFKVVYLGSLVWSVQYACNGGGWNDRRHFTGATNWGDAKGETFRFGSQQMTDTHDQLQYKTTSGAWPANWGGLPACQSHVNNAGWGAFRDSNSKYRIVAASGSTVCN